MEEGFVFTTEAQLMAMDQAEEKPPKNNSGFKRARGEEIGNRSHPQQLMGGSFKSKLLNMAPPSSWEGFGSTKDKIAISKEDYNVSEGPEGKELILSENLKTKLSRPWENAVILKSMGRQHTLNFILPRLK
ncbi:hypothetical protein ACOSQ2_011945 [Xanthoceras sorbifolium]